MLSNENKNGTDEANDIDDSLITVNNFFAHFIKEISITRYGNDKQLMSTFSSYEIYQYSDAMLKHLPEKALRKLQNVLLYSKKKVSYNKTTTERRTYNSTVPADITDDNLGNRLDKFKDQLKNEYTCRIPLRYFSDIGKINFPLKIDFKIKCHPETEMKRLFESKKEIIAIGTQEAKIIFAKVPYIQHEQFLQDKNFRPYFETLMISKKILRMGMQKTYEISVGSVSLTVESYGSNRQFDWLELLLVYNKSDKHLAIYNSYNVKHVAKKIKSVSLQNFTESYSHTNEKRYDVNNNTEKHLFSEQFVVWNCNGCSVASLTDYINSPIYQELPTSSDERIYINLRASYGYTKEMQKLERNDSKLTLKIELKSTATKKYRLRVWGYSRDELLYILAKDGLTLERKTYSMTSEDNDFE